jgi:NADH-ubiquinone oxidoreductase chain 6
LIFLGGILVLFIYITSLASNEIFNLKIFPIYISFFLILFFIIIILFVDKNIIFINFTNNETSSLQIIKPLILENSIILNKIYNFPINLITILLIIYLFLTLVAVVKITNIFEGPLRPKN